MIRTISIVLVVAIALQTVGCSTWRPLARMNQVPEDNGQSSMRDQVLGKLKEGMRVRIKIREGSRVPIASGVIECVIEEIGQSSLKVTPFTFYAPDNISRKLTLHYADIKSVEYLDSGPGFVAGLAVGAVLVYFLLLWSLTGLELD